MAAHLQKPAPPAGILSPPTSTARTVPSYHSNNPFRPTGITPPIGVPQHSSQDSVSSQRSNPFRTPKHTPHNSEVSSQPIFSPISPIEDDREDPIRQQTARPHGMSSEPRRSVDLRRLDGTPYPAREDESEGKPRKVKVAQDMYAGEMPPGYDGQSNQAPPVAKYNKEALSTACAKCGGHQRGASEVSAAFDQPQPGPGNECGKCSKMKSMPPTSYPHGAMGNTGAPPQAAPRGVFAQNSEAGPSGTRHKCAKCGRRKRPESMSTVGPSQPSPPAAVASARQVPQIETYGVPIVGISIEPPTAITEYAPTLPYSPASTSDRRQLIQHASGLPKEERVSRSGSISSLFRTLSRRNKSQDSNPLPSQQLASKGEQNPSNIIDKISNAIRDGDHGNYSRLRPGDYIERPGSPFSFVDKPQEEQTFEMGDMRKAKQAERRNSWDKADENTNFLVSTAETASRPRHEPSKSMQEGLKPANYQDDVYLALPSDNGPGMTRFKSLRSGVNRAANGLSRSASQISRSTSLRRLESVKKVPQLWYRNDMAIEGAQSGYDTYAY